MGTAAGRPQVDVVRIARDDLRYPAALGRHLCATAPTALSAIGNLDLLREPALALFCSVACPGSVILKFYDLVRALRDAGVMVSGGFHSPMERECLDLLLRGRQPLIVCAARAIDRMRLPAALRPALDSGRLLVLSPFVDAPRRATAETADERNRVLGALAGQSLVAHAAPGSKTERLCRDLLSWGKPVYTIDDPANDHLVRLGAEPIMADSLPACLLR